MFAPLHPVLAELPTDRFPGLDDCNVLLAAHLPAITAQSGVPLRLVAQEEGRPLFEAQYEPRCYLRGEVQTREANWHDLFNALVWLTFPRAKAAINARHFQALAAAPDRARGPRGGVRDMLTLLDESGVIVACANSELEGLLRDFQWKELFWRRRTELASGIGFYVFGHSLYEKALRPYVGMTGHGLLLAVEPEFFGWSLARRLAHLNDLLGDYLAAPGRCQSTRELTPVPVLGVPGWSEESANPFFYDNYGYFRVGRLSSSQKKR